MKTFYNEFDPFAAKWLRGLIKGKQISEGVVDDRDFKQLKKEDVAGYERCHFFAGIGGWDLALQFAGWEGPVWTASLPCQPFSVAGRQLGEKDDRHLFPAFRDLIAKCRPPIVFGEQVASKAGRLWLAGVRSQMEALGYSVGAADLCAAGIGAPHIRQRLFWVANSQKSRFDRRQAPTGENGRGRPESASGEKEMEQWERRGIDPWGSGIHEWITCADGKARRLEPGIAPLAHGIPGRVGLIRGYGNAIVPKLAAEFITAFKETQN